MFRVEDIKGLYKKLSMTRQTADGDFPNKGEIKATLAKHFAYYTDFSDYEAWGGAHFQIVFIVPDRSIVSLVAELKDIGVENVYDEHKTLVEI